MFIFYIIPLFVPAVRQSGVRSEIDIFYGDLYNKKTGPDIGDPRSEPKAHGRYGDMENGRGFYIRDLNGVPTLFHGETPFPAAAYMTYLEEYSRCDDFARAGCRLFSFPVLFAGRWISVTDGLTPFGKGIFDDPRSPDYSGFDNSVRRILEACPNAYLLPRVNVSAPAAWLNTHPECADGTGKRESLFSEAWLDEAEAMLRGLTAHVRESGYRDRIAGYHIAAGNTEEWFHFDMNAGLSPAAQAPFAAFLAKRYPNTPYTGLPELGPLKGAGPLHGSEYLARYLEFANAAVAQGAARLARAAKEAAGAGVIVGVFYGYSLEVASPLLGTHALQTLLQSDAVDFVSSPNSYIGVRDPDTDWTEMYTADSVRLRGKLCFQECDIRTHLTKPLGERAPRYDPNGVLDAPIWRGLSDRETALQQMRKSFCRQLVHGNGYWWFDMWGGWYGDEKLMAEIGRLYRIYEASLTKPGRGSVAEVAVFTDERAYFLMTECGQRNVAFEQRGPLGYMGAPYDIYDVFDFMQVFPRYKAAVFAVGLRTDSIARAEETCKARGIPYLSAAGTGRPFTAEQLRALCKNAGVHIYCADGDIVYVNNNYVAVHAVSDGVKTLRFLQNTTLCDLLDGGGALKGTEIKLPMRRGETRLFER